MRKNVLLRGALVCGILVILGMVLYGADKTVAQKKAPKFDDAFAFKIVESVATEALRQVGFEKASAGIIANPDRKAYTISIFFHKDLSEIEFYTAVGSMIGVASKMVEQLDEAGYANWHSGSVFGHLGIIGKSGGAVLDIRIKMGIENVMFLKDMHPITTEEQRAKFWDYLWSHLEIVSIQ